MRLRPQTLARASMALLATLLTGWAVARGASAELDPVDALREGNRLFREDRLEPAYEAYRAGWDADAPHPVLLYNLATTAHHLGRLPEAVLWYRRAAEANPGDHWVEENLQQARAALGLEPYPPPGPATWLARHRAPLYYTAAVLAWAGLILWILRPRRKLRLAAILGLVAGLLYAATALGQLAAADPAVLVEDCSDAAADLPAGSEIWIVGTTEDSYETRIHGTRVRCPASAVRPILPTDRSDSPG